jgi:hypothetical protein
MAASHTSPPHPGPQDIEAACSLVDFGGPAMLDCARVKELPTVTLSIGGREFTLAGHEYVLRVDAGEGAGGWGEGPGQ